MPYLENTPREEAGALAVPSSTVMKGFGKMKISSSNAEKCSRRNSLDSLSFERVSTSIPSEKSSGYANKHPLVLKRSRATSLSHLLSRTVILESNRLPASLRIICMIRLSLNTCWREGQVTSCTSLKIRRPRRPHEETHRMVINRD